jgi:nonsense-mediated mRNA decay protein 3
MTLQQTDVTAPVYWRNPFESLATSSDLVEFVILDIEPSGPTRGRYVLADAQVTRVSGGSRQVQDDAMGDDGTYHTRTHLGAILQPGDTVLGFHLTNSNFNSEAFEALDQGRIPDVILVKKTYPNRRRKPKARNWKLRSIAKEAEDVDGATTTVGRGALGRKGGVDQRNVERDYELFLRDLEEDKEMRAAINLYKTEAKDPHAAAGGDADVKMSNALPGSGMKGGKKRTGLKRQAEETMDVEEDMDGAEAADGTDADDGSEDEDDFPEIDVDELLEHFEEMKVDADDGEEVE